MATVPYTKVTFKQLATTLLERSERGRAILCLYDETLEDNQVYEWDAASILENTLNATVTGTTGSISTGYSLDRLSANDDEEELSTKYYIKVNGSFKMTFTTVLSGTIRLGIKVGADAAGNNSIIIDGTEYALNAAGDTILGDLDLAAGKHTITKGTIDSDTAIYLFYVGVKTLATDSVVTQTYKTVSDIITNIYSSENIARIKQCLNFAPYEVIVISGGSLSFSDYSTAIIKASSTGWIAACSDGEMISQSNLASWIKSMENQGYTYKAVGTVKGKDCKQYVYFDQVTVDTDGNTLKAEQYLPSLLGILASCNVSGGVTNFLCTDLSDVTEVDDEQEALDAGQLILANRIGGVRIVAGINSLVTLDGSTATEDMQYIETVEAMNLIKDDIREEFVTTYQGKFKNKYSNQLLFIGAVNAYFDDLANEDILDSEYDNIAEIDVDAQRSAWVGSGKDEAEDWDDDYVKSMSYKRTVFVKANIKILNCMENLEFTVTME